MQERYIDAAYASVRGQELERGELVIGNGDDEDQRTCAIHIKDWETGDQLATVELTTEQVIALCHDLSFWLQS